MDNRMDRIDEYIYMRDGSLVYESLYQKQFTPAEFSRLLALCEDYADGDNHIRYNAVIDEWEDNGNA